MESRDRQSRLPEITFVRVALTRRSSQDKRSRECETQ